MVYDSRQFSPAVLPQGVIPATVELKQEGSNNTQIAQVEHYYVQTSSVSQVYGIQTELKTNLLHTESEFQLRCWDLMKVIRERFPEALKGVGALRSKEKFAEEIQKVKKPAECHMDTLEKKYDTAFDSTSTAYPLMAPVSGASIPTCDLLQQSITSSSETDFSRLLRHQRLRIGFVKVTSCFMIRPVRSVRTVSRSCRIPSRGILPSASMRSIMKILKLWRHIEKHTAMKPMTY